MVKRYTDKLLVSYFDVVPREYALGVGNYLIGTSSFATIKVKGKNQQICGTLIVDESDSFIKCTSDEPAMFINNKRVGITETIHIGDSLELHINNTKVKLTTIINNTEPTVQTKEIQIATTANFKKEIIKNLITELNLKNIILNNDDDNFETKSKIRLILRKIITQHELPKTEANELEQQLYDEVTGLGPLESLLLDPKITEIMVNRKDQIFVEKEGKLHISSVNFSSEQSLLNTIERIVSKVGRRIDLSSPIVDARLPDGSRINAVLPCLSLKGACLTIRRFSKTPISIQDLIKWNSINDDMANFLKLLVEERKNLIISGGTGSGKTTLLNGLSSFIPNNERIITIEDSAELQLQQEHLVSLEARPPNLENKGAITIRDLVRNTLRMRPDRIIVGECRGGETLDMLQAMNTGHDGSMTTAHANSPEDMLRRLETMVMMSGMTLPLDAIREQIASAISVIIQLARTKQGSRLVTHISWISGLNRTTLEYQIQPIFYRNKDEQIFIDSKALERFCEKEEINNPLKPHDTRETIYG